MATPNGKRSRDPEEEEMYLDNFHSHKRYLSEIMASSLNGLSVGDSLTEGLMESPSRDEVPAPYSPMSEDSDDSRCICDVVSRPTSPVSPHRHQKSHSGLSSPSASVNPYPLPSCTLPSVVCAQTRQRRSGSDSESRFPSSPSDMCHTADLRRAALLRSVQMRTQPNCSGIISGGQGNIPSLEEGGGHRNCYQTLDQVQDYGGEFSDASLHQEEKCFDVSFSSESN